MESHRVRSFGIIPCEHSYTVAALQSGVDGKSIQEALDRHAAAITLDVCWRITDTVRMQSAERMEMFIQMNK